MTISHVTPEDEAMLQRWWAETPAPRRPALNIVELPAYAPTLTITCRACGKRDTTAVDWPGLVCRRCRGNLDEAETRLRATLAAVIAEGDAATDAWLEYQAGLDDALAARWTALVQARDAARARLDRALTGKRRSHVTDAEIAQQIAEARAAWDAIAAKVARTAANTENPLATLLTAEALSIETMRSLTEQRRALEIGLAEIDAARDGAQL